MIASHPIQRKPHAFLKAFLLLWGGWTIVGFAWAFLRGGNQSSRLHIRAHSRPNYFIATSRHTQSYEIPWPYVVATVFSLALFPVTWIVLRITVFPKIDSAN